ncbi:MAG: hypothetical protein IKP46_02000 [Bacteroidales bacterium]|nr:hypothetical protein [Bacteroidales bacterium]
MKKTITILLIVSSGIAASAQTYLDAYNFSFNDYLGTARSVAMGNALTAVGGDIGSVAINPAGSAVAGYSQVSITPGFSVSNTVSQGTALSGESSPYGFENQLKSSRARFTLPSVGATFNFNTRRSRGIKNVSLGFIYSTSNVYLNSLNASGTSGDYENTFNTGRNMTTISGYFAQLASGYYPPMASGYSASALDASGAYDAGIPWEVILAYRGGLIATRSGADNVYVGAAEKALDNGDNALAGLINQNYSRLTTGSKGLMIFNLGLNISDYVYIGANLSLVTLTYSYSDSFRESVNTDSPANVAKFKQEFIGEGGEIIETRFDNLRYRQFWKDRGTGINAKFGIIGRPVAGLRLGLTVQTPTATTIKETYSYDAQSQYVNANFSSSEESPSDKFTYKLRSPWVFGFGVAYTIFDKGLISADYELTDYSGMMLSSAVSDDGDFSHVNADISDLMGFGHTLRVGAEYKPIPAVGIRAGFNYISCAEKDTIFGKYMKTQTLSGSLGAGYSSPGSFFVDAAVRLTFQPDSYYCPYGDYHDATGRVTDLAPEILTKSRLLSAMVTVGWRF